MSHTLNSLLSLHADPHPKSLCRAGYCIQLSGCLDEYCIKLSDAPTLNIFYYYRDQAHNFRFFGGTHNCDLMYGDDALHESCSDRRSSLSFVCELIAVSSLVMNARPSQSSPGFLFTSRQSRLNLSGQREHSSTRYWASGCPFLAFSMTPTGWHQDGAV